jgi:Peptidase family M48
MRPSLFLVCLSACGGDATTCDDPAYGDGVCDLETTCGIPDIDCFETFDIQADAQAWYVAGPLAKDRPPAPATDPRFARMEALLLDGWEAYKAAYDLGDLADATPQLVLIDSPDVNAFAMRAGLTPQDRIGLAVMVHTGLIDLGAPDDALLGVVMHELAHGLRLHLFPEVKDRLRTYYLAGAGTEPIGREQTEDAIVRLHAEPWIVRGTDAGYFSDLNIAGLPLGGRLGTVFDFGIAAHAPGRVACTAPVMRVRQIQKEISDSIDKISGDITLAATAPQTILTAMTRLRDECFVNFTPDVITVAAAAFEVDESVIRKLVPADLLPMIEDANFVVGIYNWLQYNRRTMRELEAAFTAATGAAWNRVRYFSTEEDADDVSVVVLDSADLRPDAITDVLLRLKVGVEAPCRAALAAGGAIPYGDNLVDDHHGDCWRGAHARDYRAIVEGGNRGVADRRQLPLGSFPGELPVLMPSSTVPLDGR